MKDEIFILKVGGDGIPYIQFRHNQEDDGLYMSIIKRFLFMANQNGIQLENPTGLISDTESYEDYVIKPIVPK